MFTRSLNIILTIAYLKLDIFLTSRASLWIIRPIAFLFPQFKKIDKPNNRAEALRIALVELGPIYIKLGQVISIRPDLFPIDIVKELTKLQDNVKPFDITTAIQIIEDSLGENISDLFCEFDKKPLASASVAQVHSAITKDGDSIIIKILRPNIKSKINKDIKIMRKLAKTINLLFKDSKRFRLLEVIDELEKTLYHELDLTREAANAAEFKRNFTDSEKLYVPKIYWRFTKKSILVMEKIHGIPITDVDVLKDHSINIKKLAETGVEIFFTQVFRDRFFHADMHPGNIFVSAEHPQDPKYIAVDFGIVGYLEEQDQIYLGDILLAFMNRDFYRVAYLHRRAGWIEDEINLSDFADEIRVLSGSIFNKPLKDISFGHLLLRLWHVGRKFDLHVQPQLLLFQKTLFAIEGLGKKLYPDLNIWNIAKPLLENWQKELLINRFNPMKNSAKILDLVNILPELPPLILDNLKRANKKGYVPHHGKNSQSNENINKYKYFILGFSAALLLLVSIKNL